MKIMLVTLMALFSLCQTFLLPLPSGSAEAANVLLNSDPCTGLYISPASISVTVISGQTATFTLSIKDSCNNPIDNEVFVAQTSVSWIGMSKTTGVLTIALNSTGLSAGTHTGSISISSGDVTKTISVSFTVTSGGGISIVGTWTLERPCGNSDQYSWYINSNGTFSDNAGTGGTWTLNGDQVTLSYSDAVHTTYSGTVYSAGTYMSGTASIDSGATSSWCANANNISCTYTISPTSQSFTSSAGTGSVTVTPSSSSCTWTATESLDWVNITSGTSGASGTGSGTVTFSVSANTSTSSRTGTITIAGQTFTITQDAAAATPKTLTVAKSGTGSGTVTSNPAGINCGSTCSYAFPAGTTTVTLTATANADSTFTGWSGGGCSGTGICSVSMNTGTTVTASFEKNGGVRAETIPVPTSQQNFIYPSLVSPISDTDLRNAKPIGVGNVATGGKTLSLHVMLGEFSSPVDIYLGIYAPSIDSQNIYLVKPDNTFQPISMGLIPWKKNVSVLDEKLFGDISVSGLPSGKYTLYIAVTPAGHIDSYSLWETYFGVSKSTVSLTPNAKVLDDAILGHLLSVSADGTTFVFDGNTQGLDGLSSGDVLIFGISNLTPTGALRKITNISRGGQIIIETSQATLADAMQDGTIEIYQTLTSSNSSSVSAVQRDESLRDSISLGPLTLVIPEEYVNLCVKFGNLCPVGASIKINGKITVVPSIEFVCNPLSKLPENPRLLSLGMNGCPERSLRVLAERRILLA